MPAQYTNRPPSCERLPSGYAGEENAGAPALALHRLYVRACVCVFVFVAWIKSCVLTLSVSDECLRSESPLFVAMREHHAPWNIKAWTGHPLLYLLLDRTPPGAGPRSWMLEKLARD